MALSKVITKKSVNFVQEKLFRVTFNLSVLDEGKEVINKDYSVDYQPLTITKDFISAYKEADSVNLDLKNIIEQMNKDIEQYKAEQAILNNKEIAIAINAISDGVKI